MCDEHAYLRLLLNHFTNATPLFGVGLTAQIKYRLSLSLYCQSIIYFIFTNISGSHTVDTCVIIYLNQLFIVTSVIVAY